MLGWTELRIEDKIASEGRMEPRRKSEVGM
jgi:hypothetical protein